MTQTKFSKELKKAGYEKKTDSRGAWFLGIAINAATTEPETTQMETEMPEPASVTEQRSASVTEPTPTADDQAMVRLFESWRTAKSQDETTDDNIRKGIMDIRRRRMPQDFSGFDYSTGTDG